MAEISLRKFALFTLFISAIFFAFANGRMHNDDVQTLKYRIVLATLFQNPLFCVKLILNFIEFLFL